MATLKVNRGTTYTITYRHKVNGASSSLVGATVFFTAKTKEWDTDLTDQNAAIKKTISSHTDAAGGVTSIELTPSDTNITPSDYVYDIKVKNAAGQIYKTDEGKLQIDGSPTNRQS